MSGWTGPQAELEDEATRVLAALAAARIRGSAADAAILLDGYRDDATRLGIGKDTAWVIFATASVKTVTRMLHREAHLGGYDVTDAADWAITAALDWTAAGEH